MSSVIVAIRPTPSAARAAGVFAKAGLILLLVLALLYPESSHLKDKAGGLRAVGYPLVSFTVPALWWVLWRDRVAFPWAADLMVTVTCFSDVLGNRMDLYDTVVWFDDLMHFVNVGLLTAALLLLTLPHRVGLGRLVERALAFGATAAIAWEIAEFFAFISGSSERQFAYADTLGDLGLGACGALAGALLVHRLGRRGLLARVHPLPPLTRQARTA
jgi:hypothetical protein